MAIDIEEYYKKYGPMVLRRCRFLLRNEEKALDAMQDTFVKLLRYQDKLHSEYPSGLLQRIATNVCLNIIAGEKKNSKLQDESTLFAIDDRGNPQDRLEAKEMLDLILKNEKVSTREIAVLHYMDKLTLSQVAREVGLSVSGVRKRLRNLRLSAKKIKEAFI